jgi:hypothetical protein
MIMMISAIAGFSQDFLFFFFYGCTALVGLGRFFQFPSLYGMSTLAGDQPVARPLPAHGTAQTQNKRTETSIPRVGFEPTIPAFERAKTVHASDRAATVIGFRKTY